MKFYKVVKKRSISIELLSVRGRNLLQRGTIELFVMTVMF